MTFEQIKKLQHKIKENISQVIIGKDKVIDYILISLFCSGHVLLEDVPGTGKTVLSKALAKSIDCNFKRIQFTPDLLPSDLTGINYYNQKQGEFCFRPGPIFTNILLADEINRATPRTQSSLLECMEEKQVTIDGDTKVLNQPFFVIATQNPIETQGTFPLPEAQLDRFFMKLKIGYPTKEEGKRILDRFQTDNPLMRIKTVASAEEILEAQQSVLTVKVSDTVKGYILDIIEATRNHHKIVHGISPRGSLALMKASQVLAIFRGRDFVTPDDVKEVAVPVLSHRIIHNDYVVSNSTEHAEMIIREILQTVPVPAENI